MISGADLISAHIRKAGFEGVDQFKRHGDYWGVGEEICWGGTRHIPICARMVDVSIEVYVALDCRFRLVTRRVSRRSIEKGIFAATAPLEARET
eukprot:5058529-Pyramimonas_sp.AAC.1